MKDRNIIVALNRVLTEHFGVACLFKKFSGEVTNCVFETQGVIQFLYCAEVEFYSSLPLTDWNNEGVCVAVYQSKEVGGNFECVAYLLYNSELRKKILKAMLKHNGG